MSDDMLSVDLRSDDWELVVDVLRFSHGLITSQRAQGPIELFALDFTAAQISRVREAITSQTDLRGPQERAR